MYVNTLYVYVLYIYIIYVYIIYIYICICVYIYIYMLFVTKPRTSLFVLNPRKSGLWHLFPPWQMQPFVHGCCGGEHAEGNIDKPYRARGNTWKQHGTHRDKISHTRNQHLRNHRGFSVACSKGISLFSGIFQRIVICPVDFYWNCPMDFRWHFPVEFHFCEIWCVIFCPEQRHWTKHKHVSATRTSACTPLQRTDTCST